MSGDAPLLAGVIQAAKINEAEISSYLSRLRAADVDQLAEEVGEVLSRITSTGSNLDPEAPQNGWDIDAELLCGAHVIIINRLNRKDVSYKAFLTLFLKSIATPTNLKSLLQLTDADTAIGPKRCIAICIMHKMTENLDRIHSIKLDKNTSMTIKYIQILGKILQDEATRGDDIAHCYPLHDNNRLKCECFKYRIWQPLCMMLKFSKDDPSTIVDVLDEFDWHTILALDNAPIDIYKKDSKEQRKFFTDTTLTEIISMHARSILLVDSKNSKARSLLRKIGGCKELFHRVLHRIITGEIYSQPPATAPRQVVMQDFTHIILHYFSNCILTSLTPPPWDDDKTNKLLDCAVSCLQRGLMLANITTKIFRSILEALSHPLRSIFLTKTDEERFEMFLEWHKRFHSNLKGESYKSEQEYARDIWRKTRKLGRKSGEIPDNDICANCFATEKDIKKKGKTLLKCSSCKQITYCSRECQLAHWKKHKRLCQK